MTVVNTNSTSTHPAAAAQAGRRGTFGWPAQHRAYPWIATAAAIVMLIRCASTVSTFNHTIDEPFHLAAAMGLYDAHKHVADITHPPIAWLVAGFVPAVSGVDVPSLHGRHTVMNFEQTDAAGAEALFQQKLSYWQVLTRARLPMLLFPLVSLFYLYRLGRWLANSLVAMLAVVFFSSDPSLLGHSALINNDVAACAAYLAGLYYGLRWIVRPSMSHGLAAGVAMGLGLGTKFTLTLLAPGLILVLLVRPLREFSKPRNGTALRSYFRRWPSIGQILTSALACFVVLWATYLFNIGTLGDQVFFNYTDKFDKIPAAIRQMPIPMPSFLHGFMFQAIHSRGGHESYLNGKIYQQGHWLFFPESFALKEPISLLAGLVIAVGIWLFMKNRRLWPIMLFLLPAGVYFLAAETSKVMIGLRHLLPIVPLIYLFICIVLVRARLAALAAVLAVFAFVETAIVHPDYVAYTNLAAGGPANAGKFFADSNLDWGQDVARLAEWYKTDPRAQGRVHTYRIYSANVRLLLAQLGLDPRGQDAPPQGIFAISKSARDGFHNYEPELHLDQDPKPDYSWLDEYKPIAHVGYTIDVYDLGPGVGVAAAGQ